LEEIRIEGQQNKRTKKNDESKSYPFRLVSIAFAQDLSAQAQGD